MKIKLLNQIKNNHILKSSAALLAITLGVKLLGYMEKLVLAYYYGTSYQVDVYTVILTLVLSIFFFSREIIEPGFLNSFLSAKNNDDEQSAWGLFNKTFRLILILTVLLSIITIIFPENVMHLFAPGFKDDKLKLSVNLIQIAIPACIFLALSTLTSITLNGLKSFALPASGELAFKGIIIVCMVVFFRSYGIIGAVVGIVLGSIARLLVHMIRLAPKINFKKAQSKNEYTRNIWKLTWPLLLGVSFSQLSTLIDNVFASYLQEGAIAALSYAKKVAELPVIIFPFVLSIVVFPYFSELALEKNIQRLSRLLSAALKWIVIVFIPLSIFFFIFSVEIIRIIFQRGAFDADSSILTAKPLMVYATGLVFLGIEAILVIFYYANADTKTPIFVGIICVIINIILTYILIRYIGYIAIAVAFVVQKTLKNIILLILVKNKIEINFKKTSIFLTKTLIAGIMFAAIVILMKHLSSINYKSDMYLTMAALVVSFIIGGLAYLSVLHFTGVLKTENLKK